MIADTQDIVVDTLAPTLTVSVDQSSVKAGDQVTVTLTSSEPLDGTAGDVMGALTTPNLSMVAGSATVAGDIYTATYEALADVEDATNEVSVAAGALGDAAGNTNAAVSSANYVVDSVTPEIDGIVRVGPNDAATGELTNADTLHFRVNFSEPVDLSTVTPGDFVVSAANPDGSDATGLALTIESGFLADDGQIGTGSLEPGTARARVARLPTQTSPTARSSPISRSRAVMVVDAGLGFGDQPGT